MTLEEKAKQYADKQLVNLEDFDNYKSAYNRFEEGVSDAYIAGAKENGIVWHKVVDGDLPKDSQMVLVYTKEFGIDIDIWTGKEFDQSVTEDIDVIAWCEIPTYKE